jgi:protein phosphatase
MRLQIAALTDSGLTRDHNEDAYVLWDLLSGKAVESSCAGECDSPCFLMAVSDGMGGPSSGEVASQLALETLQEYANRGFERAAKDSRSLKDWLAHGVELANQQVYGASRAEPSRRGMGATLSVAVILDGAVSVAHVGDSRIYLLREDRLLQLTEDHSHVQRLVAHGTISVEEARVHHQRNLLLRAIGSGDSVEVDAFDVTLDPGNRLLICSDGLHALVEDEAIAKVLGSPALPSDQCETLVRLANDRGGYDNITVVIAHVA